MSEHKIAMLVQLGHKLAAQTGGRVHDHSVESRCSESSRGCIPMIQAATMTEQVVEQFQRDRSEWFSAPVREILGEYETWRSGQGSAALSSEAIEENKRLRLIVRAYVDPTEVADDLAPLVDSINAAFDGAATPTAPDLADTLSQDAAAYSEVQVEEMKSRREHVRASIHRCHEAISEGGADHWWHRDLYDLEKELSELNTILGKIGGTHD